MRTPAPRCLALALGVVCLAAALFPACESDRSLSVQRTITGPDPLPIPPPTSPENLLAALQVIYNDPARDANERLQLYRDLFPPANRGSLPGFTFHFQPADVAPGDGQSWGLDEELEAHVGMFGACESGEVRGLELSLTHLPAEPIEFPGEGQEDWAEIFVSNVFLRIMFNPEDGLVVDGAQARFLLAPTADRWFIVDWTDLPRP